MSGLTHIEKQKLEGELGMESGRVLEFSNRTFEDFFREVVRVEIYSDKFAQGSGSKAHRMRAFWKNATAPQLQAFLSGILEAWDVHAAAPIPNSARTLLLQIAARIAVGTPNSVSSQARRDGAQIEQQKADILVARLMTLSNVSAQERGYEFESFLKDLFDAYGFSPRASFRLTGEQIDGSFMLHNETYLLEAKWQNSPIGAADLHTFEGKLGQKAAWSRGLFLSHSGFSPDGLHAFGRGKQTVCMDGFDLSETLRHRISFAEVLGAKIRKAAETGDTFTPVRELFLA